MQQAHLELPLIMHYYFTKENKHILRIDTSDRSKIVINSPEVYFRIKRPHAEVGNKNIMMFSYKKHLDRFCKKGKQFI
jgi:hypothetical protein